ncbi:hypothetical protein EV286_101708 [Rhizobium sp. BK251]|nr:hypothetical protein EV286_101708 [Rhizobium sp. BK251]
MFDPGLFGLWPKEAVYGAAPAREGWSEAQTQEAVDAFFLETKSGEVAPQEELRVLLNDMTREMRGQFDYFRDLRAAAASLVDDGDEAAGKLARADVKAATDAMSLIVRTLEKVDGLQRQLARDRELEVESRGVAAGYDEIKAHFLQLIEERADERARTLFETWKRDGAPPGTAGRLESAGEDADPG